MQITRKVVHGAGRGKTLGYPTANLRYYKTDKIKFGVWGVKVSTCRNYTLKGELQQQNGVQASACNGLAIVGPARTFNETKPKIEVHIFNFHGNLYGKKICVEFLKYLRPIRKFCNAKSLITQIKKDCKKIKFSI